MSLPLNQILRKSRRQDGSAAAKERAAAVKREHECVCVCVRRENVFVDQTDFACVWLSFDVGTLLVCTHTHSWTQAHTHTTNDCF